MCEGEKGMKLFNSIQLVVLFMIYPFVLQWVLGCIFYGATVLFWALVIGYIFSGIGMVVAVYESFETRWRG